MNLNNDGTRGESTLVKRRSDDLEYFDLDAKTGKSEIGEIKTLHSNEPTTLDFKEFNYELFFNRLYFLVAIRVEFSSCL